MCLYLSMVCRAGDPTEGVCYARPAINPWNSYLSPSTRQIISKQDTHLYHADVGQLSMIHSLLDRFR